jgi:ABC-type Mn2+/Zn2+ transport system permease subunit
VLPAATARQFTSNYRGLLFCSVVIGVVSTAVGLVLSYHLNLASGATIVLFSGVLFFLSLLYARMKEI